ncbi:T9SS type A sorting domain-containing protein [Kaistella antarctica]|uniref:Por secretion system C-terminal sorting domain n=1 Tax=Kaistella antarctica TaxID=266748 RepID=A0A448NQD6_9FLAO|nr:T9SS type A sorting domain-containing protein [Kaistella antarctica]SEW03624.1 Por secretion system C-terminal sorting domain-containing protein [Kaistella antarctica]VEH98775.1 Por secretion system C-terminal sorting domain [Kaistella antarctica]
MRKFYSLFAAVILAASINAQGAENFETRTPTAGTAYEAINFVGQDLTTWSLTTSKILAAGNGDAITGQSALLNKNGTISILFPNGVGNLKFQYRKAFTGATVRKIEVSVDGVLVNTTAGFGGTSGASTTIYDYSFDINKSESTTIEIKVTGAQTTLDNFSWTEAGVLAVGNVNAKNASLVKNTVVGNTLMFSAKADIQILNMNGQVVRTESVTENTSLEVSSLAKGMYVVTATVNGKAVSQKIIKK